MVIGGAVVYPSKQAWIEAKKEYEAIRKRNTDIMNICRHTRFSFEQISIVKDYLFFGRHILTTGCTRFAPDFAMAQSWLRLSERNGSRIQPHDVLLLQHELYEISLLINNPNYSQSTAHSLATKKYDYQTASNDYYNGKNN